MMAPKLIANSLYVPMRDGVRMAVSVWLTKQDQHQPTTYPALLITTRYWRDLATQAGQPPTVQKIFYPLIEDYSHAGYRVVIADVRGTGASFGTRRAEIDSDEVEDISDLINWVGQQAWCDGRVATTGTSYSANTTLYSLVSFSELLKVGVCRAPDFDMYRHLFAPGGIVNYWFVDTWGGCTAELDRNNIKALYNDGYFPKPKSGADHVLGVRPVDQDTDGSLLAQAVAEHKANFNIAARRDAIDYIDNFWTQHNPPVFDPDYRSKIEKTGTPIVIRCGWHDAATQLGALAMFATFSSPVHAIIGPWNHDGSYHVDPFQSGNARTPRVTDTAEGRALTIQSLDTHFKCDFPAIKRQVDYYTLGENRWKTTTVWPLPNTQMQRWYCDNNHQLTLKKPTTETGFDRYQVDPATSTGQFNRWYAQASNQPICFPDRQDEDKKLLIYDTPPLTEDIEITGHPMVQLYLCVNTEDAQFFVYLETVDPDGRVRLLTDGQLRGIHRKISTQTPPYKMFGPYHSLREEDAEPMVRCAIAEISFDLLPVSVRLKKGQRIRLAIAGADCDTFAPLVNAESTEIILQRSSIYPTNINLPVVRAVSKNIKE